MAQIIEGLLFAVVFLGGLIWLVGRYDNENLPL
jgi:hypothetical protein